MTAGVLGNTLDRSSGQETSKYQFKVHIAIKEDSGEVTERSGEKTEKQGRSGDKHVLFDLGLRASYSSTILAIGF